VGLRVVVGESSVVGVVRQENIDLMGPVPQVFRIGISSLGVAANVVPIAILLFLFIRIAQSSVMFTGNTRLPMVAGWDHLLPVWFTRLHPRFKTPLNSILFVGAMTVGIGLV